MRCQEIMKSDVKCLSETDTIQTAARKMRDLNVGFLPVCDNNKNVLGTLTDRDIAIRVCAAELPVSTTRVAEVMTREVVACRPEDDLEAAEKQMSHHHKSRILVIDRNQGLRGIISLSDIAEYDEAGRVSRTLRAVAAREVQPT
jgi:CBS domain-containing protein